MLKNLFLLKVSLISLLCIGCKQNNIATITRMEANTDVDSFAYAMKEIHPNLFWECSEQVFNDSLDKIHERLVNTHYSPIELYKHLQPLTTILGDGHTQLYFPKEILQKEDILVFPLPIEVNTNDSTLWLKCDYNSNGVKLKKGIQLLSVNGKSYRTLVEEMLPYCSGEQIFFRLSKVNRDFNHFLYMLYPSDSFSITYKTEKGQKECNIDAVPYHKYTELSIQQTAVNEPYKFEFIDNKTALMTFNAFKDLDRFKLFVDSMFYQLHENKTEHLIIDLRNNGGGDSNIGDELFQYISDNPFLQFGQFITRYSNMQKKLAKDNWGADYYNHSNGIDTVTYNTLIPLRNNPLRYNGKITLLISHATFSSASAFAWTFKKLNRGPIVGEESGGMSVCFGDVVIYRLPHSKIASTISFARVYLYGANDTEPIHGVLPDIEIPQEKALEFVLHNQVSQAYN